MNSIALEQLDLFDKIYNSSILVQNTSGKSIYTKGKCTIKSKINNRKYIHTFIVCGS